MSDFTVRDAVAWLGITWEAYVAATKTSAGRHGGPMISALLAAQKAHQSKSGITAQQILDRFGIDPANPAKAHQAFDARGQQWD